MPWKATCPMDERLLFVLEKRSGAMSMAALCRAFGITRQTGHKWVRRFSLKDPVGSLAERSRRPLSSPLATSALSVRRILQLRRHHPTWGPRKLLVVLRHKWPQETWPAASTVGDILKRAGRILARPPRNRLGPRTQPFGECREPNDLWCIDFKGQFRTTDGLYCYPLTITDAASRFLFACVGQLAPEGETPRRVLTALFRKYGLPKAIRCDNGEPFTAARAPRGISQLSAWWIKLGIVVERIDLARPDQNSRHERMHRTLKNETASPPCASLAPQQAAFDRFRRIFNHQRPHEALGQVPPATVYQKSKTKYPAKLLRFTYPFATTCLVGSDGCIRWPQGKIFISSSLSGEAVGVQRLDERYAEVLFGPITIGLLDCSQLHRGLLRPRVDGRRERFIVSAMSPV
jgi:transposase InsO family protein